MSKDEPHNIIITPDTMNLRLRTSNVQLWVEDTHLYSEYRERVTALLSIYDKRGELTQGQIIDAYIFLHMVLETSLSAFYRTLASPSIKKGVEKIEVYKNIDSVSFLDKTIMFIYNSSFDFKDKEYEATKHQKIIGHIRNFNGVRNKLLHGHAIGEGADSNDNIRQTELKSTLSDKQLLMQVQLFAEIMDGMQFYFSRLNLPISNTERTRISDTYLRRDFIPKKLLT